MPGIAPKASRGMDRQHSPSQGLPRKSMSGVPPESWNVGVRGHVNRVINSLPMKVAVVSVISVNCVQVVYECDTGARCKYGSLDACAQAEGWIRIMNWVYLCLYSVEISLRLFVHRLACFENTWDIFDCAIVFVGIVSEIFGGVLPSTGALRLFRLAKLARAFQIVKLPQELHLMFHGFISALKAIGLGSILMGMLLLVWTIVAVEFFNDLNHSERMRAIYEEQGCDYCVRFWSSVPKAMLTLAQLTIMGEGWEDVIAFIEEYPWSMLIFMGVYFTVVLGMANLVLAVIVDKALQSHDEDIQEEARLRAQEKSQAISQFVVLCEQIDEDQSGHLTMNELLSGYDTVAAFKDTLSIMDICKDDLIHVFQIMDKDHSGDVSYNEFAQQLEAIKGQELQTMVSFIKHWVQEIWEGLEQMMGHIVPEKGTSPYARTSLNASPPAPECTPSLPMDEVAKAEALKLQEVLREVLQDQFAELQLAFEKQTDALSKGFSRDNFFDQPSEGSRADTTDAPMLRQFGQGAAQRGSQALQVEVVNMIQESEKRLGAQLAELSQRLTAQSSGGQMLVSSSWASCNFPVRNAAQPLPEIPRLV